MPTAYINTMAIAFLLLFSLQGTAQILHSIELEGLKKTKVSFLQRFLESSIGQPYDSLTVEKDIQALKNLNYFHEVKTTTTDSLGGKALTFHLKEVFTLLPILSFGGIKDNFWLQLGAVDNNLAGRGITLGGYYRYYERHSAFINLKIPYLKGSRWGISASFLKWATREPIQFDTISTVYNYDNLVPELLVRHTFRQGHYLEGGGAYLYESYQALEPERVAGRQPITLDVGKYLTKIVHHIEDIRYDTEYLEGFSNELLVETVYTPIYSGIFWKTVNESKYFRRIGKTGNLAFRLRLGLADNGETAFPPFVLDSYINLRGVGNRVLRGTGELVLNAEYRLSLLRHKYGVIQAVTFIDAGALRKTADDFASFNETKMAFYGLGLRLYLKHFYNFVLRADFGFRFDDFEQRGFVIGVGQYF